MNYRKATIALLLSLLILAPLMACTGQKSDKSQELGQTSTEAQSQTEAEVEPDSAVDQDQELDQVLRIASGADPKRDLEAQSLIFDSLVIFDQNREIVPNLARSWEINEDFTEFKFKLAEGVKFSDGTDLTEADYEKSLRILGEAVYAGYVYVLEDISFADGELTLKFSEPQIYCLQDLAKVAIAKADQIDAEGQIKEFIGTGPYMIKDYEAEVETVFVKNPYYWNSDRPHKLEQVVWKFIPDPDARKLALESNLVDIIGIGEHYPSISRESLAAFRESGDFAILDENPDHFTLVSGFMFNWKDGPLADLELRRAIEYAVDRQVLVDSLFFGEAQPSGRYLNPAFLDGPKPDEEYNFDLDKSRRILDQAGYVLENGVLTKDGQEIVLRLLTDGSPTMNDIASFVQSSLQEIGIKVEIKIHEGALIKDVLTAGDYDIDTTAYGLFEPLVSSIQFNGVGTEHGPLGLGFGASQEILDAADRLLTAQNEAEVSQYAKEYWTGQYEACSYLPLYTMSRSAVYNKAFTGFKFSADVFRVDLADVERIAD